MIRLKFDTSEYILVKEIVTGKVFATLKSDTQDGQWQNLLDEEVRCIPVDKSGELAPIAARNIVRRELDTNVWIRIE